MKKSRRAAKTGTCAFCGICGEVTDDHIPPQNLFVGVPDSQLVKVPSCDVCNNGSSLDDEYFRAFLIPQAGVASHPQAQKLNKIVRQKFDLSDRKGLERRMESQRHFREIYTPFGIYLGNQPVMYPEFSRIDGSLKKIVRGLLFHTTNTQLPSEMFHTAAADWNRVEKLQKILKLDLNYWLEALDRAPSCDIADIFSYKYSFSVPPRPLISTWRLTFFGFREFFGITYPKTLCGEIKVVDADPTVTAVEVI